jgi:taurine dioxygenase
MTRLIETSKFYNTRLLRSDLSWGVILSQLRIADLMDPQLRQELYDLWIQEGVIVFEGIDDVEAQLGLSRIFGPLRSHPTKEAISESGKELMDVGFDPEQGWLMEVDGEPRGTWLPWHSDLIYVDKINHGGILRPVKIPSKWGETGFIDKISAYERLPDDLKRRIEGLNVLYRYDMDLSRIKFGKNYNARVTRHSKATASIQARLDEFPGVLHPMVYAQPETGRKVLNVSSWFACGIYELPGDEGDALLEQVVQYAVDERFAYYHPWKLGEMVLWDNWRMLHCATGTPVDEVRFMQRTTIGGDYGLGRVEPGTSAAKEGSEYIQV